MLVVVLRVAVIVEVLWQVVDSGSSRSCWSVGGGPSEGLRLVEVVLVGCQSFGRLRFRLVEAVRWSRSRVGPVMVAGDALTSRNGHRGLVRRPSGRRCWDPSRGEFHGARSGADESNSPSVERGEGRVARGAGRLVRLVAAAESYPRLGATHLGSGGQVVVLYVERPSEGSGSVVVLVGCQSFGRFRGSWSGVRVSAGSGVDRSSSFSAARVLARSRSRAVSARCRLVSARSRRFSARRSFTWVVRASRAAVRSVVRALRASRVAACSCRMRSMMAARSPAGSGLGVRIATA